jgi:hypothetical protein
MTTNNPYGITGVDGEAPIYDPNGRFQVWALSEIYRGGPGENRYVPKVGDLVEDMDLGLSYKVVALPLTTLVAQLVERKAIATDGEFDDILLGPGPGTQSDTYRCYLDRSVMPYSLTVDARLTVAGTMCRTARIFRGADLTDQGHIVAHMYDSSGNILGDQIPLELVVQTGNISVRTVPVAYTTEDLPDNEIVTAVFYSDVGSVVSKRQMLIENTAFVRQANLGMKYITDISLKCPFLSQTDADKIELPMNVILSGVNMIGVVHYNDGSTIELPVDGTKFAMLGIDSLVATVVGQRTAVSLRYRPSAGEVLYGGQVGQFVHKSRSYTVEIMQQEGAYSVKLFPYPVWIDGVNGYTLRWYLYNGDRNVTYDVTGEIEYPEGTPAWNPILYGVNQRLTVAVNLQHVNGAFKDYRHVQTIDIVLRVAGTDRTGSNWTIAFEQGQNPPYGQTTHANITIINSNLAKIKLDMGLTTQEAWLAKLYLNTKPIIDQSREVDPPTPTHFRFNVGGTEYEYPIAQWNGELQVGSGLVNSGTLFVEFVKRTPETDLYLSVAGMPIWQAS